MSRPQSGGAERAGADRAGAERGRADRAGTLRYWRTARIYRWPAGIPFTPTRALPEVALIVGREWWPLPAAVATLWVARVAPATAPAAAAALVLMVAVEEYAHLAAVARLCPEASLALVVRPPLRIRAESGARLGPDDAAASALAGPFAAVAAGALVLTIPLGALKLLLRTTPPSYADLALPLLPPLYAALSALPLPGSDAAVVLGALRRRRNPAFLLRHAACLVGAAFAGPARR